MANEQVSIKRGLKANIPGTKTAGQILVATDTGEMFVDDTTSSRIQIKDPTKAPIDHTHPAQTSVTGNAGTATKLATARTINGTAFDGSVNITTANWGTARTLTIGSSGKSVNGSANVSWSLNDIGAVSGGFHVSVSGKTAAGWYRIATSISGIGNCNGIFIVTGSASGVHDSVVFTAGTCYGVTSGTYLSQLGCASYTSTNITKARIVYNTTYSNNYAYLEVYVNTSVSTAIDAKFFGTGWSRVDATTGSIPSGYTSKEISFNNTVTFIGSLSGNASTATTASKLGTNAGSATQPVYFSNGVPVATTYTLGKSVPSDAKFTDTVYTLPLATSSVRGGVKIGYTQSGKNYPVQLSNEQMYVNVPWTDNNTWIAFKGATASSAGTAGYVPAPASGQTALYFRSDGTWATPPNTTYSVVTTSANGLMSSTDKTKLDGIASGANNYSLPTATSSVLGGVKIGLNISVESGTISVTKTNVVNALGYTPPTTNTTYSVMGAASSSSAGTSGLVPAPAAGKQASFLRGDGTWVVPTNTDTKVTQSAAITTAGSYPVLLGYSTATTAVTNTVNKSGKLLFNPSTGVLTATEINATINDGSID